MIINPKTLNGEINAIPSKSDAHRAIICALLSRSKCTISPIIMSNDIKATINTAISLGAKCEIIGNKLIIDSSASHNDTAALDCAESGSTLRFMLAVTAALGVTADFGGSGRLPQRPINEFYDLFSLHGATMSDTHLPLKLSGKLTAGEYKISGNISSQFITGLLLALPILDGNSKITLTTKLQSKPYIDMTINTMRKFGVNVIENDNGWDICGNQHYNCESYIIDGDWSQAAFFLVSGAVCGKIKMLGLNADSMQGDKEIMNIIKAFGGNIYFENGAVISEHSTLFAVDINAENIPDLVPIISVLAANSSGITKIYGAERLRYKESDRIKTVVCALKSFGVDVKETNDGMIINGKKDYFGGKVDCANDHRIAMAFAIMAAFAKSKTELIGESCVDKSYPDFFEDFKNLQDGED